MRNYVKRFSQTSVGFYMSKVSLGNIFFLLYTVSYVVTLLFIFFFLRVFSVFTTIGENSNKITELNYCYNPYYQDQVCGLFDCLHSLIVVYCKYEYSVIFNIIF